MKIDKKTKMSYTVIGNKENGTVEIIFGGSNSNFNKKIARSRRLSISGRWIAFFVKKLKKGYTYDTIFV